MSSTLFIAEAMQLS